MRIRKKAWASNCIAPKPQLCHHVVRSRETSRQDSGDRPFNDPQDIKKMARSGALSVPILPSPIPDKILVTGS